MEAFFQAQSLFVTAVLGIAALTLLILSADQAVTRILGIADYLQLSATFMGMTVMSLATSIPEISSHLTASAGILDGSLDFAVGSAVVLGANIGSDVVQQTLIMGMVVFAAGGLIFHRRFLTTSLLPMIGTTLMCIAFGLDGTYSRLDGLVLFGTFIGYSYYLYRDDRNKSHLEDDLTLEAPRQEAVPARARQVAAWAFIALLCMAVTIASAQVVLSITTTLVGRTGVGGSLIGVLTLGIASALPELTTAISGIRNKEHGISLGTLVGSNITNPLVAIGGGALVSTYWVPRPLVTWDLPWETITGAMLWAMLWFRKGKLGRGGAIYLIAIYFVYIGCRALFFAVD